MNTPKFGSMGQQVTDYKIVFNYDPFSAFGAAPMFWVEDQEQRPLGKVVTIDAKDRTVRIDPRPWEGEGRSERSFVLSYERYNNDWSECVE